ncbi:hypothetical protein RSOLAG22IIIB_01763 [Rhizoctonia solani]|uniref:B box-type domain-containing protein n=1 Tax=Rhizoctonia solani TaxID=456999 RepID=A0A0K6G9T1_9AGAM|nr:hypothetical protein RSOLAG22IIIB_01763 [Rhizoctonia solani]
MDYTKDPSTSADPRWTAMTGVIEEIDQEVSCVEPRIADTRPRKRRRITSNNSIATQPDVFVNHQAQRPYFSDTRQHASGSVQFLEFSVETHSQETCQTCRKCKSNYYCSRCSTPTCSICTRTCTIAAMSTPPTPLLCFSATPSPKLSHSRLRADDYLDGFEGIDADDLQMRLSQSSNPPTASKRRSSPSDDKSYRRGTYDETNDTSWWGEPSSGGCGRVICQACVLEDANSHESTCLDCLHGSGFSFSVHRTSNGM